MFRIVVAAGIGSGVGSAVIALCLAIAAATNEQDVGGVMVIIFGPMALGLFSMLFSIIPTIFFTALLGPLVERLATRQGHFDMISYLLIVTFIFLLPNVLFGSQGFVLSATSFLYGYPAAVAYRHLKRSENAVIG